MYRGIADMDFKQLWNEIVAFFKANPQDVSIAPMRRCREKWFYVYVEDGNLYAESGRQHLDVSRISVRRNLKEDELPAVYALYVQRKQSKSVSREATETTYNASYWFGILKFLGI